MRAHHHQPAPTPRAMLDLGAEELLVVGALRAWMARALRPDGDAPRWGDLLGLAEIRGDGADGFAQLMSTLGHQAWCLIEIHDCPCPTLGEDEARLIVLLRALQTGSASEADAVLDHWLPPDAAMSARAAAARFARAMMSAGWRLPAPVTPFPVAQRRAVLH